MVMTLGLLGEDGVNFFISFVFGIHFREGWRSRVLKRGLICVPIIRSLLI